MSKRSSFLLVGFFSHSSYAAECTTDQLMEINSQEHQRAAAAMAICTTTDFEGNYDCSEKCQNTLKEYTNLVADCTSNGTSSLRQAGYEFIEQYNTQCGTNVGTVLSDASPESSGAHGYSAAHCMLAILVPMALLCL